MDPSPRPSPLRKGRGRIVGSPFASRPRKQPLHAMKNTLLVIALLWSFCATVTLAQSTNAAPEDPAHQELRALRDGLLAAMNKSDLEASLAFLHTNCVITWHNAEVSRGHAGVRAYNDRVMKGPKKL